jgi:1-acyl-sn-glycerol-3-phosphate acyltransferase
MKRSGMSVPYRLGWLFFRGLFTLIFRCRYLHPDRVPRTGGCILAANHCSYLDPPLVGSGITRQVGMLARNSLFRFPVFGTILRSWGAVPVDPQGGPSAGLRSILDRVADGDAVLIFPEGTRSPDGMLLQARSGLGLSVIKANAPVVPVRIWGTFEAYGRHSKIPKPKKLTIKYGQPLTFPELRREAETCSKQRLKEIYRQASEQVMMAIRKMTPDCEKERFP